MADFGGLMIGACLNFACAFNCDTLMRGAKINQNKTTSKIATIQVDHLGGVMRARLD